MSKLIRRIKGLRQALLSARLRKDADEITRLEALLDALEKQYVEPSSPLHANHHRKENTTSINNDGFVEKA